ncbi:hypothetical protein, conserved [Eimeria necatrix]|uniref:Transmembrane protein n=1 Tax=Eimeria necatrix TaxID=51315 RepID=U6MI68_9EIME|nr:hypothetical protein, conserved [Eimeria necatrix]CDJ63711.1 hypothetical protein, conserved [Eimeria necatrix]
MRWALVVVAVNCISQTAVECWHEHFNRYAGEGQHQGYPHPATYTRGPHVGHTGPPDSTLLYPGSEWYGVQQEAMTEGSSMPQYPLHHHHGAPSRGYNARQQVSPWGSLLRLAKVLQHSAPQQRTAFLRQFCFSVVRLRTPFVGLGGNRGTGSTASKENRRGSESGSFEKISDADITVLATKLSGVVGAAEGAPESSRMLAERMLLPFGRLVEEGEQFLFDVARQGDATLMISALSQVVPPVMKGLSYLEAPQSQGASGVLEPVRDSLLRRARELDRALLAAQGDPQLVSKFYRDATEEELQREKNLAAVEGSSHQSRHIPPVIGEGAPLNKKNNFHKVGKRIATIMFLCLAFFTAHSAMSRLLPSFDARGQSRSGAGRMGGDFDMERLSREVEAEQQEAFRRHEEWFRRQQAMAQAAFNTPNGSVHHDSAYPGFSPGTYPAGPYASNQPPSAPQNTPNGPYGDPSRVTPSAPPMPPGGFSDKSSPPPSYAEAMGLS